MLTLHGNLQPAQEIRTSKYPYLVLQQPTKGFYGQDHGHQASKLEDLTFLRKGTDWPSMQTSDLRSNIYVYKRYIEIKYVEGR